MDSSRGVSNTRVMMVVTGGSDVRIVTVVWGVSRCMPFRPSELERNETERGQTAQELLNSKLHARMATTPSRRTRVAPHRTRIAVMRSAPRGASYYTKR